MKGRRMRLRDSIGAELRFLLLVNPQQRPWQIPLLAALAVGLPLLTAAWLGHFGFGITTCLGALVILYMPQGRTMRRGISTLAACGCGFVLCFALGAGTSFNPWISALTLGITAALATALCRLWALPPPGTFFFIMITALGSTAAFAPELIPLRLGLVALGSLTACLLALAYNLCQMRGSPTTSVPITLPAQDVRQIVGEAVIVGVFVGGSYAVARWLGLDNPYWVPISCAAIMQGASLRLLWQRKIHRILGTGLGMLLAWGIFSLSLSHLQIALVVMALQFVIEVLVVRNYGLAMVFITPLTVLFADAAGPIHDVEALILARMFDILLGSVIGFFGGWACHGYRRRIAPVRPPLADAGQR
jgi:uncharacterized membrane protein YccC